MISKLVFVCFAFACVFAAPPTGVIPLEQQQPTVIPIVSQSEELESNGTYKFSYETGNGIKREETSYDKVVPRIQGRSGGSGEGSGSEESDEIHVQKGSYSYTAPDGTVISVSYIADENGFRAVGDHIPKVLSAFTQQTLSNSGDKSGRALKVNKPESNSAPIVDNKTKSSQETLAPRLASAPAQPIEDDATPNKPAEVASTPAAVAVPVDSSANSDERTSTSTSVPELSTTAEVTDSSAPVQAEVVSTLAPNNIASEVSSTSAAEESSSEAASTFSPATDVATSNELTS